MVLIQPNHNGLMWLEQRALVISTNHIPSGKTCLSSDKPSTTPKAQELETGGIPDSEYESGEILDSDINQDWQDEQESWNDIPCQPQLEGYSHTGHPDCE